jgi:hypothetical protein
MRIQAHEKSQVLPTSLLKRQYRCRAGDHPGDHLMSCLDGGSHRETRYPKGASVRGIAGESSTPPSYFFLPCYGETGRRATA